MREHFKSYLSLVAAALAFSTGWSGMASADTVHPPVAVFVNVENRAQAPESLVTNAEKQAEKVYRQIGIRLVWTTATASLPNDSLRLTVVLVPESKAGFFVETEERVGRAVGTDGRGARRAYVFPDRVRNLTTTGSDEALVLGAVIAHEIGHLLLPPNSHSNHGIMRGQFRLCDFDRPDHGGIRFTAEQALQIRAALSAIAAAD